MANSAPFLDLVKGAFRREEFSAKSLLVTEGTFAKKLFYIEWAAAAGGSRPARARKSY
jgi:hypothetical protein